MKRLLIFLLFLLSACSTHLADITVASNKNVNLKHVDLDKAPQKKWAEGRDTKFMFLFIPFGSPQIKEALNQTLRKGDGDILVDGSVYYESWWFLFGERTIKVQGNVIKTRAENK